MMRESLIGHLFKRMGKFKQIRELPSIGKLECQRAINASKRRVL